MLYQLLELKGETKGDVHNILFQLKCITLSKQGTHLSPFIH